MPFDTRNLDRIQRKGGISTFALAEIGQKTFPKCKFYVVVRIFTRVCVG
jgi:hypothetical protein